MKYLGTTKNWSNSNFLGVQGDNFLQFWHFKHTTSKKIDTFLSNFIATEPEKQLWYCLNSYQTNTILATNVILMLTSYGGFDWVINSSIDNLPNNQ
jgi:hypothetical protein